VKRILVGTGLVLLALVAGIAIYFLLLARGIVGVDDWTVRRVVAIVNNSLEPQLDFDAVSLAVGREANEDGAPYAIRFEGITLTAPDGTEVVRAAGMRVSLAEMPRRDRPGIIETITLESPEIRLIREQRADGTTGFRGLVPFVKPSPTDRDLDPDTEGATTLSDVLALRRVIVTDASIHYEDRTNPDLEPMQIAGIGFELLVHPEQTPDGRTLHALDVAFGKAPILDISIRSHVDLDTMTAQVDSLSLRTDLAHPEAVSALPPELQELIAEYEIRGMLDLAASGLLDVQNPESSAFQLQADLTDANFASGEYRLPVASLILDMTLSNMVASTRQVDIQTLSGMVRLLNVQMNLGEPGRPLQTEWLIEGVQLLEALRAGATEDPTMAGLVTGSGNVRLNLDAPGETAHGSGLLQIREGRLARVPILSDVLSAGGFLSRLGNDDSYEDHLDAEFTIQPGGLSIESLELKIPVAKFSGSGMIGFSGEIDLRMRGGAVERIPVIGHIVGAVTGRLVEYRVTRQPGEDTRVRVNPLGIGN
jgi:hypothetical protein